MSGIAKFNIPAFDAVAADLRRRGYDVVSPAELDDPEFREWCLASEDGVLDGRVPSHLRSSTWGDLLARDVKLIADRGIEAIVCLEGWKDSKGARLETFVARDLGLPILEYRQGGWLHGVYALDVDEAHGWREGEGVDHCSYYDDVEDPEVAEEDVPTTEYPDPSTVRVTINGEPLGQFVHIGEIRVTDPVTGGQKGQKLAQIGALDPLALLEVGKVAGFGAIKYDRFNFAKGYAWSLSYDALQRHLMQWAAGDEEDDESGLSHLGHAAWHCLALLTFVLRERGTDDRLHRMLEEVA